MVVVMMMGWWWWWVVRVVLFCYPITRFAQTTYDCIFLRKLFSINLYFTPSHWNSFSLTTTKKLYPSASPSVNKPRIMYFNGFSAIYMKHLFLLAPREWMCLFICYYSHPEDYPQASLDLIRNNFMHSSVYVTTQRVYVCSLLYLRLHFW